MEYLSFSQKKTIYGPFGVSTDEKDMIICMFYRAYQFQHFILLWGSAALLQWILRNFEVKS